MKYSEEKKKEATERIYLQKESTEGKTRNKIRIEDRRWFLRVLGIAYMEDKEIHHNWENGVFCRVLTPIGHRIMAGIEKGGF